MHNKSLATRQVILFQMPCLKTLTIFQCHNLLTNLQIICYLIERNSIWNIVFSKEYYRLRRFIKLLSHSDVFALYTAKFTDDSDLHRYEKELAATDKAIKNILAAIEEGIFTPSTKQRLTELEEKKIRLEQAITIESAKEKNLLTKEDIVRYITDAVKLSAKQMIELLVERIDVHVDKICIKLRYSDTPPDITTDPTDKDSLSDNDIKEIEQNTANARPDRKFSCRGFLLFSFTKEHEISRPRTYKSGRSRIFTYTRTFMLEIYI